MTLKYFQILVCITVLFLPADLSGKKTLSVSVGISSVEFLKNTTSLFNKINLCSHL